MAGQLGRFSVTALSLVLPSFTRSRTDVFRDAAALTVNEALQPPMLLPQPKLLPDLWATALDEILAVRVLVDHELYDPLVRRNDRAVHHQCSGSRTANTAHELPAGVPIYGYIYEVKPGRLIEVPAATEAGKA